VTLFPAAWTMVPPVQMSESSDGDGPNQRLETGDNGKNSESQQPPNALVVIPKHNADCAM